ncbi:MAG TPA: PilT/PilU family type 4a pilus ATPase [Candidatus Paceibacterota bacterium]|jgi:twitching motility protein PilT|nr:PilT/PilU family type 4a pilus ATPase [Candidatus Paceibacterota bacterium]
MQNNYQQNLETLLDLVIQNGASDLHLGEGRHPFIRVDGELTPIVQYPQLSKDDIVGMLGIMISPEALRKISNLQEVDFAYDFGGKVRFRGNVYIKSGTLAVALRAIQKVRTLQDLHLPDVLQQFIQPKQGFFLVVGPVGQGKSTTLAAMIDMINSTRKDHIVTIEHPIEYIHVEKQSIIDQREVELDTVSFADALSAVFRQDVDVILVGEMRDPETIKTAVTAAETGHLVFSTLHTNSASQTVDRIIDSFPAEQQDQVRIQLAGSLLGIFSQRLLPSQKGGLVPAFELLINTKAVANVIRENRTHEIDMLIETGTEHGMLSLNHSLLELVRSGDITLDEARSYSSNPQALDQSV